MKKGDTKMNTIILSDEDLDSVLGLLRREVDTLNDDGSCKRLIQQLRRSPATEVYLVLTETEIYGAWTDPRDAVMWIFDDELDENLEDAMIKMLSSDYPALVKMSINPAGEPWMLSR